MNRFFSRLNPTLRGLLIIAAIAGLIVVFQLEQTLAALLILARVAFLLAIAYFIFAELLRIRWEESVLSRTFPRDYPDYARRVPRYAPNPFKARG